MEGCDLYICVRGQLEIDSMIVMDFKAAMCTTWDSNVRWEGGIGE